MANLLGNRMELTPEEAVTLARKLLESAELVLDRRERQPGCYDYQTMVCRRHDGGGSIEQFKFRIGATE